MSDFTPDYLATPEALVSVWKEIAAERAAEIARLTAELAEAVAMVNEMDEAGVAAWQSLTADIDAWHEAELSAGRAVPDFWDECGASEWLASHLTALGYVRARRCPMPTTCGAEFCLPDCDTDSAAAAFATVGELMADLHDETEVLADYDRASVSGRSAGHPISETTPAMPQYKRDGWDRECVICACKWMEEADTECPQCAMKDKPTVQQTTPTPRPRATPDGVGGVSGGGGA